MSLLVEYTGGCHCGRLRFEVTADLASTLDCNCSICTKKGFLHLIVNREHFRPFGEEAAITVYRFGTRLAQHMFCNICGVSPYYVPRSDPDKVDVNVRCIDGLDLAAVNATPFDGRHWEAAQNVQGDRS